jgi:type II secretory pathway pseudopilin PulG
MAFCAYCGTEVRDANYLCTRCGNPVNGAPKPAASKAPIALIIVIVMIPVILVIGGILAAIAIPNLLTATQRAKQKRTMADIRTIATACEAYATDHGSEYPKDLTVLESTPQYLKAVPRLDGWGHPWKYECWSKDNSNDRCDAYAIGSAGKDGMWEHSTLREYEGQNQATTTFNSDVVYVNGSFVESPDGIVSR